MIHRGEHIRKKVKESGMSIQSIADKVDTTRPTLYKWFLKEDLGNYQMIRIAKVINYNIFVDFPEMEEIKEEDSIDFEDSIYKKKYYNLLEKHVELRETMDELLKNKG